MEQHDLKKIRDLGLTERTSQGREGVRVTAQCRHTLEGQLEQRKQALEAWINSVAQKFARHGGEVVPDSLSVLGQTVEAIIPVDAVEDVEADVATDDIRLDLVVPRRIL